jgi:hypothetical protein
MKSLFIWEVGERMEKGGGQKLMIGYFSFSVTSSFYPGLAVQENI